MCVGAAGSSPLGQLNPEIHQLCATLPLPSWVPQNLFILIATIASGFIVSPANLSGGWLGACEPANGTPVCSTAARMRGCNLFYPRQAPAAAALGAQPSNPPATCPCSCPADYANPVSYFLQALVVNEFESPNWGGPAPDGQPGQTAGNFYLQERCGRSLTAAWRKQTPNSKLDCRQRALVSRTAALPAARGGSVMLQPVRRSPLVMPALHRAGGTSPGSTGSGSVCLPGALVLRSSTPVRRQEQLHGTWASAHATCAQLPSLKRALRP